MVLIKLEVIGVKHIKYCHSCKQTKATEDFYKTKSANDGLDSRCKDCQKERNLFLNPNFEPGENKAMYY